MLGVPKGTMHVRGQPLDFDQTRSIPRVQAEYAQRTHRVDPVDSVDVDLDFDQGVT